MNEHSVHIVNVLDVLKAFLRHPIQTIFLRWNWKCALLSSFIRALIFFCTNISAGLDAAIYSMSLEFVFRSISSGFYGAMTQAFRYAQPAWLAAIVAMIVLPFAAHTVEYLVHWIGGTRNLTASITASVGFSAFSTLFNLYAMRKGILVVNNSGQSFLQDMKSMPRIVFEFVLVLPKAAISKIQEMMSVDHRGHSVL